MICFNSENFWTALNSFVQLLRSHLSLGDRSARIGRSFTLGYPSRRPKVCQQKNQACHGLLLSEQPWVGLIYSSSNCRTRSSSKNSLKKELAKTLDFSRSSSSSFRTINCLQPISTSIVLPCFLFWKSLSHPHVLTQNHVSGLIVDYQISQFKGV